MELWISDKIGIVFKTKQSSMFLLFNMKNQSLFCVFEQVGISFAIFLTFIFKINQY